MAVAKLRFLEAIYRNFTSCDYIFSLMNLSVNLELFRTNSQGIRTIFMDQFANFHVFRKALTILA